ncbi:MAG: hypothetical protein AUJ98_10295 [Bacteroidetes bacterium CG2_30_33_31]|nr:MAG: hypothetical protein AUJ98_10295 [Bacteroidetes bacterium CG2_30_33_31]
MPSDATYELNPKAALAYAITDSNIISPELLASLIYAQDPKANYQFVDLRNPQDYDNEHVDGAINIPLSKIVNINNCNVLLDKNKIYIFYAATSDQAIIAGNVIRQVGIKNFLVSKGDFNYIKNNILDAYKINSANYDSEKPAYDYAKVIAESSGPNVSSASRSSTAPVSAVPKTKKKESAGGGCN